MLLALMKIWAYRLIYAVFPQTKSIIDCIDSHRPDITIIFTDFTRISLEVP